MGFHLLVKNRADGKELGSQLHLTRCCVETLCLAILLVIKENQKAN